MKSHLWPPLAGRLPPEIWLTVFDFACLDEGQTARSLSLVSRRIRALSESHRYRTIKISSTSQMVALERQLSESGVIAARILKTRFLSVTFPISIMEEAYPEDVPGVNAPSSFSGDSDYQESEWSDIHCWSDDSLSDPEGAYELDDGPAASEVGELIGEIADIEIDRNQDAWAPHVVHRLEDLDDYGTPSVRRLQFQIYGATRRLLEACSDTLEVLSLYYTRGSAFQLEVLVPPLPRLRHLSVGSVKAYLEIHIGDTQQQKLYPSLRVLRLLGDTTPRFWWKRIVQSVPDSNRVTIGSGMNLYRKLGFCEKQEGCHVWKFVKNDFDDHDEEDEEEGRLPKLLETWWLEDVNGGSGIPTEEELDERYRNGYQGSGP
ncbi:hypothetical protein FA13DRAFT_825535 [Coprinellus micaceus]|uniref:Uncharacterized protein n=1 Tax=Coprinellus micaceus TaxID=71717 RepID=A0A4Y7T1G4_COPMI|nr:hypothetical protein FA13DRAFT_825535 [Coprinellus micaceus]